jgi:hypothetical protein
MLHPMVKDFYAVIEKHYGKPFDIRRTQSSYKDVLGAANAALIIWAMLSARGVKRVAASKLECDRSTIFKSVHENPYLQEFISALDDTSAGEYFHVKVELGLD